MFNDFSQCESYVKSSTAGTRPEKEVLSESGGTQIVVNFNRQEQELPPPPQTAVVSTDTNNTYDHETLYRVW